MTDVMALGSPIGTARPVIRRSDIRGISARPARQDQARPRGAAPRLATADEIQVGDHIGALPSRPSMELGTASSIGGICGAGPVAKPSYPLMLRVMAILAVLLFIVGAIVGTVRPGPFTGLLLPFGLTIWWLVGAIARRQSTAPLR